MTDWKYVHKPKKAAWKDDEILNKVWYGEAPTQGLNPYPIIIPTLIETATLSRAYNKKCTFKFLSFSLRCVSAAL